MTRVLLLAPVVRDARPDTDLSGTVTELRDALSRRFDVALAPVATLGEIERAVGRHRPDVVFNACETVEDRADAEPLVPALLDRLKVPFTGSAAPCLDLCMRKSRASAALRAAGVRVPAAFDGEVPASAYPVIVKPEREDGSVGVDDDSVAADERGLRRALARLRDRGLPAIVEQYVDGREIAIALLGWPNPRVLSPGEILYDGEVFASRARILTYASKWDPASLDYRATRSVGADLDPALLRELSATALSAAAALGIRDYGRVDLRVAGGRAFVIDANPNCDLSSDGGFMRAARRSGFTNERTVAEIVSRALERGRSSLEHAVP